MPNPTLAEHLRNMRKDPDRVSTHDQGCWLIHDDCALSYAADLIEDMQANPLYCVHVLPPPVDRIPAPGQIFTRSIRSQSVLIDI